MFTAIDWGVVAVLIVCIILIVKKFSSKAKSVESYYMAARCIPFSLLVGTLIATWYGGTASLNSVESGALAGMASWGIYCVGAHAARIPLALWIAPEVSVRTELTIPQMVKKAYGPRISLVAAFFILVGFFSIGEIVAMRNVFTGLFGSDISTGLVIAVLIGVIILTIVGGLMGVAVTDMLLFWCLCTAIALAVPALFGQIGGWDGLSGVLTNRYGAKTANMLLDPVFGTDTLGVITLLVMSTSVYVNAALYQRFSAADTPRNASRSYLTAFCIFVVLDFLLNISGVLVLALEPEGNIVQNYVRMVCGALPTGVRALFFVGTIGAIVSTLDSYWLCGGMTVANDFVGTFKKITDRQSIFIGRITVVFLGIIGYLCAFFFTQSLDVTKTIVSMNMSVTFVVSLMGIFYRGKKTEFGAWCTMIVSAGTYCFLNYIHPVGFNGMLVALPLAFITFFLTKNIGKEYVEKA